MVFFTCNACGESLKKAQVEKHVTICRNCECLSCIDCGKDFWGEDYRTHLKCISEDQKYGGKGFEVKSNKGDVKQQMWIQKIQEVMKKPSITPNIRNILNQISGYDNIPRKKAKFQNWMKNSLKIYNQAVQDQVWEIFSEATSTGTGSQEKPKQVDNSPSETQSGPSEQVEENEKKKNKRERKEERQKKNKKEKKESVVDNQIEDGKKKKGKKRKMEDQETNEDEESEAIDEEPEGKKKKKKKVSETAEVCAPQNGHHEEDAPNSKKKRKQEGEPCEKQLEENSMDENHENNEANQGKFNWKGTIKALLKDAPDNELPVKRLRKKVLAQYYAVSSEQHRSEEDLLVIFNKKIHSNPKFKVLKEKVKLLK
ncbi:cell growth-regulating nucleolar protein [Spea bombifrons]|uniref:cell growth-regulating nucleolar protein n=1 Tax=Spea bombifrons TaxID=233779 RepID=UPI00234A5F3C|nr:cell growth-regulating nucleolar protein [Spea bombifrons]